MDFKNYCHQKDRVESAYNLYCYAGTKLELAEIKCRLAEIKSQHEPLNKIIEKSNATRSQLYSAAFFVVFGRLPDGVK